MNKKKWRDIKNALVMIVVMAAMMSTATYAWFTLTNDATVTGMHMTASGSSGLRVSLKDGQEANWVTAVDLREAVQGTEDDIKSINQLTIGGLLQDDTAIGKFAGSDFVFKKPHYNGEIIDGLDTVKLKVAAGEGEEYLEELAAVYKFYIKAESVEQNVALAFAGQEDIAEANLSNFAVDSENIADGSFMVNVIPTNATKVDDPGAKYAVRVGIKVGSNDMIIWEPNCDDDITGDGATAQFDDGDKLISYTPTVSTKMNGQIKNDTKTTSGILFNATTAPQEVYVYVWLEGTDSSCVNQIRADQMVGQLKFVAVEQ